MLRCLRVELSRAFKSTRFIAALAIGIILVLWHYFQCIAPMTEFLWDFKLYPDKVLYPHSVFNKWLGGESASLQSFLYFIILPILAVFPFGASYHSDMQSGIVKNIFVKCKRRNYCLTKYISVFVSAGTVIVIPLIISLGLTAAILPSLIPQIGAFTFPVLADGMWSELFYTRPYMYILCYMIVIFVFSGLIACTALAFSFYLKNNFVVTVAPFLIYLFTFTVCNTFGALKFSPFNFLNPAQSADNISFGIICAEGIILFLVSFGVFMYKGIKDDVF